MSDQGAAVTPSLLCRKPPWLSWSAKHRIAGCCHAASSPALILYHPRLPSPHLPAAAAAAAAAASTWYTQPLRTTSMRSSTSTCCKGSSSRLASGGTRSVDCCVVPRLVQDTRGAQSCMPCLGARSFQVLSHRCYFKLCYTSCTCSCCCGCTQPGAAACHEWAAVLVRVDRHLRRRCDTKEAGTAGCMPYCGVYALLGCMPCCGRHTVAVHAIGFHCNRIAPTPGTLGLSLRSKQQLLLLQTHRRVQDPSELGDVNGS
jgi:hypothetical protein